jgi:hypothetical protein
MKLRLASRHRSIRGKISVTSTRPFLSFLSQHAGETGRDERVRSKKKWTSSCPLSGYNEDVFVGT